MANNQNLKGKEAADRWIAKQAAAPARPEPMTYAAFVKLHGGKSTARLAGLWRERFGPQNRHIVSLNPGGAQEPGNEGIEPARSTPPARDPGQSPSDPASFTPSPAASANENGPASIADAVSSFVSAGRASGQPQAAIENPATRAPDAPAAPARLVDTSATELATQKYRPARG